VIAIIVTLTAFVLLLTGEVVVVVSEILCANVVLDMNVAIDSIINIVKAMASMDLLNFTIFSPVNSFSIRGFLGYLYRYIFICIE
jgi:hypothetical protein